MSISNDSRFILGEISNKANSAIESIKEIKTAVKKVEENAKNDLLLHEKGDGTSVKMLKKKIYQGRAMSILALVICFLLALKSPEVFGIIEKIIIFGKLLI